ncbi:M4 family metallopeptidase [Mangrovimonas sp. YM274]|uniref:M4 family metallopeptidase n=1 Tax=Mangrovimonas sp. YM274 TaxID=3070660 RepID=UPI0027DCE29A|nr:M4 family metallopeptidase [Mangrovimonas sp. YM274]WMI68989.1 M4 family metallopeptidase [Mangrovimonas sp. YM274]
MKKTNKSRLAVAAALLATVSYGQLPQTGLPNVVNPFKTQVVSKSSPNTSLSSGSSISKGHGLLKVYKGSVLSNFKEVHMSSEELSMNLASYIGLNDAVSFQKIAEKTDALGATHANYQQYYKGVPVEGKVVMVHTKGGRVYLVNGQVATDLELDVATSISKDAAVTTAKAYLQVTEVINTYPVETVVTQVISEEGHISKVSYKVRVDSFSPLVMCHVFIDGVSGEVLYKEDLIAHADTPGTGQTYYSGLQDITCDSDADTYRLREAGRQIETYDASTATGMSINGLTGTTDFTSSTTSFEGVPELKDFSIITAGNDWWTDGGVDLSQDFYLIVKDADGEVVYESDYFVDSGSSLLLENLNVPLTSASYTVELWDYDAGNADDLGGTYALSISAGTHSWADSVNNGDYLIETSGLPEVDAHWGMEQTYDFYYNVFDRQSFDGLGSTIKQYVGPQASLLDDIFGTSAGMPNNAFALGQPYNIMVYGLGDGQYMNPVVGLDVLGHEFTHIVVDHNGNGGLMYLGEAGALNESFADIFGACTEFYSDVNADWLIGEEVRVGAPFLRSMSNPNAGMQPDTYNGTYWVDPASGQDNGGVHTNSGVQNYWFYLLAEGGTGTNDLNDAYDVSAIGLDKARQIAYRNLTTYLTEGATHFDAYLGSLQAAEDLYGNPSLEYTAVEDAWYAVGVGPDIGPSCYGTITLTEPSGTFSDGSGTDDYGNNANCVWVIAPPGAEQISLNFTAFHTEFDYDFVYVYDGPDDSYPLLEVFSGSTLPEEAIVTSEGNGTMTVKFASDIYITAGGWEASYTSTGEALGVDDNSIAHHLKVYPNPSTGAFTVASNLEEEGRLDILNILGQKVLTSIPLRRGVTTVGGSALSSGTYFLSYRFGDRVSVGKLIIK